MGEETLLFHIFGARVGGWAASFVGRFIDTVQVLEKGFFDRGIVAKILLLFLSHSI